METLSYSIYGVTILDIAYLCAKSREYSKTYYIPLAKSYYIPLAKSIAMQPKEWWGRLWPLVALLTPGVTSAAASVSPGQYYQLEVTELRSPQQAWMELGEVEFFDDTGLQLLSSSITVSECADLLLQTGEESSA